MGTGNPISPLAVYRFGPYEVDVHRGELRKFGIRVRLERKPWQLLLALLEHPGKLVTRAELQHQLWGDNVFVDFENGLNVAAKKLRTALSDSADEPAYVETVAGEGYRFIGAVEKIAGPTEAPRIVPPVPIAAFPTEGVPEQPPIQALAPAVYWNRRIGRIAATLAVLIAVAVGMAWLPQPKTVTPAAKSSVLVGAFENATGEPVLDGTLQFSLERELANSRFAQVVSPERLYDILKLMRRSSDTHLDRTVALEICRRTPDITVLVTGRVAKVGSQYWLTADIVDAASGRIIRSAQEQASKQDDILAALRRLSRQIRSDLGESMLTPPVLSSVPEPVTTSSLLALQLYSEANDLMIRHGPQGEDIVTLLEQALAEDPDFASAHILLGHVLSTMDRPGADEHFERAFALAEATNERERLFILGSYYTRKSSHPGDALWMKATAAYEQLVRHYPDDHWGLGNLAFLYDEAGRAQDALRLRVRKFELRPENEDIPLGRLWARLVTFGEVESANRLAARCDRQPDFGPCLGLLTQRDALPIWRELRQGRPKEALRIADQLVRKYSQFAPRAPEELPSILSDLYKGAGMLQAGARLAVNLPGADWQTAEPVMIAELREDRSALNAALTRALKSSDADIVGPFTVLLLANVDRLREASAMLKRVETTQPPDVAQVARGYLKLARGDFSGSIPDLRAGAVNFGQRHVTPFIIVCDRLAAAMEGLGQIDEALQTLANCENQLADWSDREYVNPWNTVARWHLAALYHRTGRDTEAEVIADALRGQLQLADQDHPIVLALRQ